MFSLPRDHTKKTVLVARIARPYRGEPYTAPNMGMAPSMWQIPVPLTAMWVDFRSAVEIPFTSIVCQCHECFGSGREACDACIGSGTSVCLSCRGRGVFSQTSVTDVVIENREGAVIERDEFVNTQNSVCGSCMGSGRSRCGKCVGHGWLRCCSCEVCSFYLSSFTS